MIYDKTMPHPGKGAQTWGKAAQIGPGFNQPGGISDMGGMMGGKQLSPLNAAMAKQRTIGGGVKQPVMNQPTRTITTDPRNQPAPYGSDARLDRGAAPPRSYNRDRFEQAMQNYDDVVAAGPSHPLYRDLVVGGTHYWKDLGLSSAGGGPDGRGFYDKQAARQYALDKWGPSGFTGGAGPSSGSSGAYGLLGALNQQRIR